mgnify:CR=1 FL=1
MCLRELRESVYYDQKRCEILLRGLPEESAQQNAVSAEAVRRTGSRNHITRDGAGQMFLARPVLWKEGKIYVEL